MEIPEPSMEINTVKIETPRLPTVTNGSEAAAEAAYRSMPTQNYGVPPAATKAEPEGGVSKAIAPNVENFSAEVEARLAAEAKALLENPLDDGDARKEQLNMRAAEMEKKEAEKEQKKKDKEEALKKMAEAKEAKQKAKEEKANAKAQKKEDRAKAKEEKAKAKEDKALAAKSKPKAKAKGRPRKGNGKEQPADEENQPAPADAKPPAPAGEDQPADGKSQPAPPTKRRRVERRPQPEAVAGESLVDAVMMLEMQALLVKFKDQAYNRQTETLHKGKYFSCQLTVYWSRDAAGVKVKKNNKVTGAQVAYYAKFAHVTLAIYSAVKMAEKLDQEGADFVNDPAFDRFHETLKQTAKAAAEAAHT